MLTFLNDIATITMGQSPKSTAYNSNHTGLPFLQGRTTFGRIYPTINTWTTSHNKTADKGDILFTVRAPVGDINIANQEIAIGRGIAAIKPTKCNPKYLYYLLVSNKDIFLSFSTGTIYNSINKTELALIKLNVHSPSEQQHIVDTIGSIDELIGKLEIEEEQISHLINTYYLKFALRSFESKKICDCFDIKIGRTPPRKETEWFSKSTNDFTWFSIKDFGNHKVFTGESNEYLTKEAIEKFHVPLLNKNTVLMSFKLTVGKTLLANKDCVCTNEAIASFNPKKGYKKYNYYLYSFLLNQHFENAGSTSSIATAINSKIIKNYKLESPSLRDIENYNQIVIPLFELIKITQDRIKILCALKNSYLKLFF